MRRTDREVTNLEELYDLLERCPTLRIAFQGGDYPYLVPVSFGLLRRDGGLSLFFHGAKEGLKVERMKDNPRVCFEADLFYQTDETPHGITTRYESVIGRGILEAVEGEEAIDGLRAICAHYGRPDYPIARCRGLAMTLVFRIRVEALTGKRNLPQSL